MRDDTARFLTAMLQGVQPQRGEVRCLGHADHAKDATFFMQVVGIEGIGKERLHGTWRFRNGGRTWVRVMPAAGKVTPPSVSVGGVFRKVPVT